MHLWCPHGRGWGILKLVTCFRILLFLSKGSIILFWEWEIRKLTIFCVMTPHATKVMQSLSVPVSRDSCCYNSSKKLNWFSFSLISEIRILVSTLRIGKSAFNMLIKQSFLKFLSIRRICRGMRIRGVSRNFLFLKIYFSFLKS